MKILAGLWINKSKKGEQYLTGQFGRETEIKPNTRFIIFKTKNKKTDKSPDYMMYEQEDRKDQQQTKPEETDLPF